MENDTDLIPTAELIPTAISPETEVETEQQLAATIYRAVECPCSGKIDCQKNESRS